MKHLKCSLFLLGLFLSTNLFGHSCLFLLGEIHHSAVTRANEQMVMEYLNSLPFKDSMVYRIRSIEEMVAGAELIIPKRRLLFEQLSAKYGRSPTVEEMVYATKRAYESYISVLRGVQGVDADFDRYVDQTISKVKHNFANVDHTAKKKPRLYRATMDLTNELHVGVVNGYISVGYGEIGELYAIAKSRGVVGRSFKFGANYQSGDVVHPLSRFLMNRLDFRFDQLITNIEDLDYMLQKYPHLFHGFSKKGHAFSDEQIIDNAKQFFLDKEIDVLKQTRDGKMVWLEVKNYSEEITKDILEGNSADHQGKSILKQQFEYLEMVDFLGLKNVVDLQIYFHKGRTPEVDRILAEYGVEVIDL